MVGKKTGAHDEGWCFESQLWTVFILGEKISYLKIAQDENHEVKPILSEI